MIEILHPDRPRKILFQSVENVFSRERLKSRTRGIEVPILILEVSSRRLRSAAGRQISQLFICGWMINAGSRREEVIERSILLDLEKRLNILQAELYNILSQINFARNNIVAVQHGKHALTYRCNLAGLLDIAEFEDLAAVYREMQGGRLLSLQPGAQHGKFFARESDALGPDLDPIDTGKSDSLLVRKASAHG